MTNYNKKNWKNPKCSENGKNTMQIMVFKVYFKNLQFALKGCVIALTEVAIIACFDHKQ